MKSICLSSGCALIAASLLLAGCGGNDGAPLGGSQFQGGWTGVQKFKSTGGVISDEGILDISIRSDGSILGNIQRAPENTPILVTGTVSGLEYCTLTWQFPGEDARTAKGYIRIENGILHPDSADHGIPVTENARAIGRLIFDLNRDAD